MAANLKVIYKGEIRKINQLSSFFEFKKKIKELFCLVEDLSKLKLTYLDSDSETINIANYDDLMEAIDQTSHKQQLKIFVSIKEDSIHQITPLAQSLKELKLAPISSYSVQ
eukprot:CAMPEP_0170565986 /NCGR_PEP_ID=MMETSP0211-20121228/79545_1 /TAXON_ID=311385 /ORGANISM="Pseudokeronopsis sp., Strain OXSARD2" /LENGTH=110 /DNA_ID=CAMNT_0010887025 /DNA_START=89 /DNA_END=421 /DNA_ORIENTATION=+